MKRKISRFRRTDLDCGESCLQISKIDKLREERLAEIISRCSKIAIESMEKQILCRTSETPCIEAEDYSIGSNHNENGDYSIMKTKELNHKNELKM